MELWIRSQDRLTLRKIEHISYSEWKNEHIIYADFDKIAIYKTKERALEVLDEIQKILKPHLIIKDNGKIIGTFEDNIIREDATYELKELSTYVYEMPKE